MELGTEGYSPNLLEKIEYAGSNGVSFKEASRQLKQLAELEITDKHIQRLTERLGAERQQQRDEQVEQMKEGKLGNKYLNRPEIAAVHLDAGKLQTRADDGKGTGVRGQGWRDTKVGCLLTYQGRQQEQDPEPEVPKELMDRKRVKQTCEEMARVRGRAQEQESQKDEKRKKEEGKDKKEEYIERKRMRSEPLVRTAVATMADSEGFGWMVAAEATIRGFYEAARKAVLGDGGNWISPLAELHFPGWVQILDFMHLMAHLYAGAQAAFGKGAQKSWVLYKQLVRKAWKGEVGSLMKALERHSQRIGKPPEKAPNDDPRKILALTLDYVRRNAHRMDYPAYRQAGLPITSAPVESLIKQFNQRVKGTEKFWTAQRVEAILQSRAAYLSQDNRVKEFWRRRKSAGRAVGQNRLQRAA